MPITYMGQVTLEAISGEVKLSVESDGVAMTTPLDAYHIPFADVTAFGIKDYAVHITSGTDSFVVARLGSLIGAFFDELYAAYNAKVRAALFVQGNPLFQARGEYRCDENGVTSWGNALIEVSITPAEGWEKRDTLSSRISYSYADSGTEYNTLINLDTEENFLGKTEREFAEKRMESDKLTLESWNPVFTDIADVTVNGYDALAYDAVTELGELRKMYFIFEGSYAYIIQCATMSEFWEVVHDDFATMIESFTLE